MTFTGRVDRVAIAEYLSRADIGLCPDLKTPLNDLSTMNKTMEYMAYGLPAVSFDLVETRVSGGDTVLYVPSGDIVAFADAVEQLIDDPRPARELGRRARERVVARSWTGGRRPRHTSRCSTSCSGSRRPGQQCHQMAWPVRTDAQGRRYVDLDDAEEFERYLVEHGGRP